MNARAELPAPPPPIPYQVDVVAIDHLDHAGLSEHIQRVGRQIFRRIGPLTVEAAGATISHEPTQPPAQRGD